MRLEQIPEEQPLPAAQVRVSPQELVEAVTAVESRRESHAADTISLGEAVDQLGLTVTPEELLAEINARKSRQRIVAAAKAPPRVSWRRWVLPGVLAASIMGNVLLMNTRQATVVYDRSTPVVAQAPPTPVVAATTSFDELLSAIRRFDFDAGRLSLVRSAAPGRVFTTEQARQILASFDFDAGRRDAAIALYPRVSDRSRFFTVLDTFSFDADRQAVIERLNLR